MHYVPVLHEVSITVFLSQWISLGEICTRWYFDKRNELDAAIRAHFFVSCCRFITIFVVTDPLYHRFKCYFRIFIPTLSSVTSSYSQLRTYTNRIDILYSTSITVFTTIAATFLQFLSSSCAPFVSLLPIFISCFDIHLYVGDSQGVRHCMWRPGNLTRPFFLVLFYRWPLPWVERG